ncbi:MAG: CHAT domain-containing protein [Chitinophagales bacterium]|nr:CHAT domain-containing protein [Chitinophagales bacterium]
MNPFLKILSFLIGMFVLISPSYAQHHADELLEQAITLVKNNKEDSASIYFSESLMLYQKADSLVKWINAHKSYGKAYRIRRLDSDPNKTVEVLVEASKENLWRAPLNAKEWDALVWLNVNIAFTHYYKLENFIMAKEYYELAAHLHQKNIGDPDYYLIKHVYKPLSNLNTRLGDYSASEVYLQTAIDFFSEEKITNEAARTSNDLAIVFLSQGKITESIQLLENALELEELSDETVALLQGNLAKSLHDNGDLKKALLHINYCLDLLNTDDVNSISILKWIANFHVLKGDILLSLKRYDDSELELKKAERLLNEVSNSYQNRDLAGLYQILGRLYNERAQFEKSILTYHRIFDIMLDHFDESSWHSQPNPSTFSAEYMLIDALFGKAETLYAWYQKTADQEMLQTALKCHELIYEVEQLQRRAYRYESSKLFNVADARSRSTQAIQLALELWHKTGNEKYKEVALAFAERSKSTLMLEAFYNSRAVSLASLPDSVLQREKAIQKAIADAEESLYSAKSDNAVDSLIQQLEMDLLSLKQQYADWIKELEQQYPRYYKLKYNLNTLSSTEIQNALISGDQAFLEYFIGDKTIYVFLITTDNFRVFELEKDFPLEDWVIELRENIEAFQFSNSDRSALCESYNHLAYQLYNELIKPLEANGLPEGLLIVPDGVLGFVPFDALLSDVPHPGCKFSNYPYLLQKYHIQYAYSATLQSGLLQRSIRNKKWIGFAPSFDGANSFGKLTYNQLLVEGLQKINGGKAYMNKEATISNLSEIAEQYGLFHFATHAQANTEAGDFSFIVFSNGQGGYDSLFVKDIYLLPLQAEMAVLSACETAVGKLYQGEGIINLARSFLYAGANSVITTQWSINDATNRELMERFYNFLHKGYSKSEALRLAKQEQVKNGGMLHAHPAYWAAFAPIGNMRPVYSGLNPVWIYSAVGLSLGLILIGRWYFSQKSK